MNRAQYQKIYRKIAALSPPAKIYIYGDAQLLKDGLIQGVKKTVTGFEEFNLNVFWMNELRSADGIKEIFDAIIAFPMMTDRRVVILRNFTFSRPIEKKFVESLENFDFPNSTVLLIEADELKKNIKAGKIIASQFETIELSTPSDKDLLDWVAYFCTRAGKKIQRGAAVELINLSGATLSALRQEIYKLANFVEGVGITSEGDRNALLQTPSEEDRIRLVGVKIDLSSYSICCQQFGHRSKQVSGCIHLVPSKEAKRVGQHCHVLPK